MSGLNRFTSSTVTTASNGGDGFTSLNISGGVISPRRSSRSQEAGLASFQACTCMVQWQCSGAKCLVWTKPEKVSFHGHCCQRVWFTVQSVCIKTARNRHTMQSLGIKTARDRCTMQSVCIKTARDRHTMQSLGIKAARDRCTMQSLCIKAARDRCTMQNLCVKAARDRCAVQNFCVKVARDRCTMQNICI